MTYERFPELESRLGITEPAAREILGESWDQKYNPSAAMPWGDNRDLLMLIAVAVRDGATCGGCPENGFVCNVAATPTNPYWCDECLADLNRTATPYDGL